VGLRDLKMKTLLMTFFQNTWSNLTLTNLGFTWDSNKKEINIQIENLGSQNTGPFAINFDAEEETLSKSLQPQITYQVKNLPSHDSINLTADFKPLAQPNNKYLRDINKIFIYVEGKSQDYNPAISTDNKSLNSISS